MLFISCRFSCSCSKNATQGMCAYLQVVVVSLAAAVDVSCCSLLQVEHGAQTTEETGLGDDKLLT